MINKIDGSERNNEELIKDLKSEEAIKESESTIFEEADQIESNSEKHQKEIDSITKQAAEEKKDKINDLMGQLNEDSEIQDQNSILHDCEKHIADGRALFNALNGDQEAIQRKIKEFGNYGSKGIIRSQFFFKLDDLSEEDLQKEYMEYFESQTSEYYLGGVINAVLTSASNIGFFSAMNGKEGKIDEDFSKIIRITQKLVNISRKI